MDKIAKGCYRPWDSFYRVQHILLRDVAPRLGGALGDALEDDRGRRLDLDNRHLVVRVSFRHVLNHLSVPDPVLEGTVYPAVHVAAERDFHRDLDEHARLSMAEHARVQPVPLHIPRPLRQSSLEQVGVAMHQSVENKMARLMHVLDHVRLSCAHGACREDEPRASARSGRRDGISDELILQRLPAGDILAVVLAV